MIMMMKKLSVAVITSLLLLAPQVALALAPGNPDIFIMSSPKTQDVPAGGSATFTISIISQEGFEDKVQLTLVDPPEGLTASFDPNPVEVPAFDQGNSVMTVNVASNAPQGEVVLKVVGKGVKEHKDVERSVDITLNIAGTAQQPPAEQPPAEQPPAEQPPAEQPSAEVVTTTVTATVTTTVTTATTVVSTVTEVMTTRTPTIGTKTTVTGFDQAADFTYPAVVLVAVVVLLAVAALALRRPGK